jgi:hypothetical protein
MHVVYILGASTLLKVVDLDLMVHCYRSIYQDGVDASFLHYLFIIPFSSAEVAIYGEGYKSYLPTICSVI